MLTISLLTLSVAVLLTLGVVLNVAAARDAVLAPMMVDPFCSSLAQHPADTLPISVDSEQTLPSDWHTRELTCLYAVEEFLDELEACGVVQKELEIRGGNQFLVRWR